MTELPSGQRPRIVPPLMPVAVTVSDAFRMRLERGPTIRESTGIAELDRFTGGGLPYGSTTFIIGAPDASKTLLIFQVAVYWARKGLVVGIHAVDEETLDLLCRLVQGTPIGDAEGSRHFYRSEYEEADADMIGWMRDAVGELSLLFYDDEWTIEQACQDIHSRAKAAGKGAAYLPDSLHTTECKAVRETDQEQSERRAVTLNARAVRRAAIQYRMITVATSESNREWSKAKRRGETVSAMAAGAESRAVEYRARCVLSLVALDGDTIEVGIPKNKLGPKAEPAFCLRINRERQQLTCAHAPVKTPASGPSAKQDAKRRRDEVARSETKARQETDRLEKAQQTLRDEASALRKALTGRPSLPEFDVLAWLRVALGACGDKRGRAIILRAEEAGWIRVDKGPKNARLHTLLDDS